MALKAMLVSTEYSSENVIAITKSILRELHGRYGDERYLEGLEEMNRLQSCILTMRSFSCVTSENECSLAGRIFHALVYCQDNMEYRNCASECWRQCIEHGYVSQACMIVNTHMNSNLKSTDLTGLKLKQLAPSFSLAQVIQLVNETLKPTLLSLRSQWSTSDVAINTEFPFFKNIILGLCVDLCSRATIVETTNEGSPFDPTNTTAVQVAVLWTICYLPPRACSPAPSR